MSMPMHASRSPLHVGMRVAMHELVYKNLLTGYLPLVCVLLLPFFWGGEVSTESIPACCHG